MTDMSSNRLLVADDDAELLALIGFALRHAGFEVDTAVDGARALDKLQRETFGLTVLDINMPGIDGFGVCERLRATSTIPVIMLSARNHEADVVRAGSHFEVDVWPTLGAKAGAALQLAMR